MATMDYAEIKVEQKYHRHIIGKGGASGKSVTNMNCSTLSIHELSLHELSIHELY